MWFAKIGIFIECYKFCGDNLLYFPQKNVENNSDTYLSFFFFGVKNMRSRKDATGLDTRKCKTKKAKRYGACVHHLSPEENVENCPIFPS